MKFQIRRSVFTLLALLAITPLFAQTEIEGVKLDNTIEVTGNTLQLNGAGVRSKYFMDLYIGAVYLSEKTNDAEAIVSTDETQSVLLTIVSGMVTRDKFVSSTTEGFEVALNGNTTPLQKEIDTFMASFSEEIAKGDQFQFDYNKGIGTTVKKNGKVTATIGGLEFKKALWNIWLGKSPADKNLKKGMLGQ